MSTAYRRVIAAIQRIHAARSLSRNSVGWNLFFALRHYRETGMDKCDAARLVASWAPDEAMIGRMMLMLTDDQLAKALEAAIRSRYGLPRKSKQEMKKYSGKKQKPFKV